MTTLARVIVVIEDIASDEDEIRLVVGSSPPLPNITDNEGIRSMTAAQCAAVNALAYLSDVDDAHPAPWQVADRIHMRRDEDAMLYAGDRNEPGRMDLLRRTITTLLTAFTGREDGEPQLVAIATTDNWHGLMSTFDTPDDVYEALMRAADATRANMSPEGLGRFVHMWRNLPGESPSDN